MVAPSGSQARPVRLARPKGTSPPHTVRLVAPPPGPPPPPEPPRVERRDNRGATARAVRLSILYTLGIALVYGFLVELARAGPTGGSSGTSGELVLAGLLAFVLAAAGALVSLGAAPRAVELGGSQTIVIGRFGRRYSFPRADRLRTTVLARIPAGLLSPVAIDSVEIAGGSTRRSFLLDERLLEPKVAAEGPTEPPAP